jgi:hypothetical protein
VAENRWAALKSWSLSSTGAADAVVGEKYCVTPFALSPELRAETPGSEAPRRSSGCSNSRKRGGSHARELPPEADWPFGPSFETGCDAPREVRVAGDR